MAATQLLVLLLLFSSCFPCLPTAALSYYPDAPDPWWGTWMYHFWSLRRIMRRYPEAAGFLWTNDDVVVNYWRLVGANKTKLWLPDNPDKYEYQVFELDPSKEVSDRMHGNWASRVQYRKQVKITIGLLQNRCDNRPPIELLKAKVLIMFLTAGW